MCKACGEVKPVGEFSPSKVIKDGYENKCRHCRQAERRKHKCVCGHCGGEFLSAKRSTKYCSDLCARLSRRKRVSVVCKHCGTEFEDVPSRSHDRYCSRQCQIAAFKVMFSGEGNPNFGRVNTMCSGCGKNIKIHPYRMVHHKFQFCSYECYQRNIGKYFSGERNGNYRRVELICAECGTRFKRQPFTVGNGKVYCGPKCRNSAIARWSKEHTGEKSPQWNPNKSEEERIRGRAFVQYWRWRNKVLQRDDYTCQKCGVKKPRRYLVAHHILNYSEHPELRTDVDNGITLCNSCHADFHSLYGVRNNNRDQLIKFLGS